MKRRAFLSTLLAGACIGFAKPLDLLEKVRAPRNALPRCWGVTPHDPKDAQVAKVAEAILDLNAERFAATLGPTVVVSWNPPRRHVTP